MVPKRGGADLGGVLGGAEPGLVALAAKEGLGSSEAGEASLSLLVFWVGLLGLDSGLGDRPLLLVNLILPGGGDVEGFPS